MPNLKGLSGPRASTHALQAGSRFKSSLCPRRFQCPECPWRVWKQLLNESVPRHGLAEKMHKILTEIFGEYFYRFLVAAESSRYENHQKANDS